MWKVYLLMAIVVIVISYLWVRGIDYMTRNHPDYKGHDLFDEEEKDEFLNKLNESLDMFRRFKKYN
mgnify:CR=1 FL=1